MSDNLHPQLDADLIAIRDKKNYQAKCAEAAMLREALGDLRANPDEFTPETWGIKCISDHNAIIDAALAASSEEWLERHDAEVLARHSKITGIDSCSPEADARDVLQDRGFLRTLRDLDQLAALREERDGLAAIVEREHGPQYASMPDFERILAARDAGKLAEGRKAGLRNALVRLQAKRITWDQVLVDLEAMVEEGTNAR